MIYEKPKNEIFASDAKDGEIVEFPNVKRGWGVTENLGFIPPMEYFNAAFNRVDKSIAYQLQRGVAEWDKDLEYPIGAVVSLSGIIYIAKSQNTNKNPSENKGIWHVIASEEWCKQTFLNKNEEIDAYTKSESDDKFAQKTDLDNFWPRNATLLPAGDYTKMGFWRNLKAGYYFFNVGRVNDQNPTNYPSSYGFVEHLILGGEHYIIWRTTDTGHYEIHFNHSFDDNDHFSWRFKDLYGLGVNQTWQDVKSQRQAGEIYTNNTDKPIFISVVCQASSQGGTYGIRLEINGIVVQKAYSGAISGITPIASVCGVIPAGATYKITTYNNIGSTVITDWAELR